MSNPTPPEVEAVEKIMSEVESQSVVISAGLWYVSPDTLRAILTTVHARAEKTATVAQAMKDERRYSPRITTELKTPHGGYIGSIQIISDVGFGQMRDPEIVINKMLESAIYSMVSVLMHKGAAALTPTTDTKSGG